MAHIKNAFWVYIHFKTWYDMAFTGALNKKETKIIELAS